jgi:hypothetical protein
MQQRRAVLLEKGWYPQETIPNLRTVRRISTRYRSIVPVNIMRRYQCAIVGAEHGILTVAIADPQRMAMCNLLSALTGYMVFPVLVDSRRLSLLLRRAERTEKQQYRLYRNFSQFSPGAIHTLVALCVYSYRT